MRLLRNLIPDFLRELDLRLQRGHPRLWSTRVHYHLWFLLLVNAMVFLLGLVLRVEHRRFPEPEALFGYMMVPAVVYLTCWTYRVVRFNVEKRFGIRRPYAEVGEFMVHLASLLLIMSIPYTLALTTVWRIAHLTSDEEFVEEVNTLNEQAPWFYGMREYHSYREETEAENPCDGRGVPIAYTETVREPRRSVVERVPQGAGTHCFFRDLEEYLLRNNRKWHEKHAGHVPLHHLYKSYIATANEANEPEDTLNYHPDIARINFAKADSIEMHFPLLFVGNHWHYPDDDYEAYGSLVPFTPSYFGLPYLKDSLLKVAYVERVRRGHPMDHEAIRRALDIGVKYSANVCAISPDSVLAQFQRRTPSTTGVYSVQYRMGLVASAKGLYYFFVSGETVIGLLISCFVFALLVSIFKNLYWQPFLIAVVVAALLPVLLLVFALITEHWLFRMGEEKIAMYGLWWIAVALIVPVPFVMRLNTYRTTLAVTTILANVAVPFIAVFTLVILNNEFDVFGVNELEHHISGLRVLDPDSPQVPALNRQLRELNEKVATIMWCALWGGMAFYLLVLHPLFRIVYTRLMALPERR